MPWFGFKLPEAAKSMQWHWQDVWRSFVALWDRSRTGDSFNQSDNRYRFFFCLLTPPMSERIAPGSVNLLVQRLLPGGGGGGNPPAAANSALNSLKVPISIAANSNLILFFSRTQNLYLSDCLGLLNWDQATTGGGDAGGIGLLGWPSLLLHEGTRATHLLLTSLLLLHKIVQAKSKAPVTNLKSLSLGILLILRAFVSPSSLIWCSLLRASCASCAQPVQEKWRAARETVDALVGVLYDWKHMLTSLLTNIVVCLSHSFGQLKCAVLEALSVCVCVCVRERERERERERIDNGSWPWQRCAMGSEERERERERMYGIAISLDIVKGKQRAERSAFQ